MQNINSRKKSTNTANSRKFSFVTEVISSFGAIIQYTLPHCVPVEDFEQDKNLPNSTFYAPFEDYQRQREQATRDSKRTMGGSDSESENTSNLPPLSRRIWSSVVTRYVVLICIWFFFGSLVYVFFGYPWPTAFYASLDAGYSIGFGSVPNPNDIVIGFTIVHVCIGGTIIAYLLSVVVQGLATKIPDIQESERRKLYLIEERLEYNISNFSDFLRYIYVETKLWINKDYTLAATFMACLSWMIFGMIGISFFEKDWSFMEILLFAVTSMSTGGLQGPSVNPEDCDPNNSDVCFLYSYEAIFVAIFCLVGVPLYGFLLSAASQTLMRKSIRSNEHELIARPPDADDHIAARLLLDCDSMVSWTEFLILKLIQLKKIDVEFCQKLKWVFDELDENKNGELDPAEVRNMNPQAIYRMLEDLYNSNNAIKGVNSDDIEG